MSELMLKYNLLDDFGKQRVQDFIDILLNERKSKKAEKQPKEQSQENREKIAMKKFKEKLLNGPVWTEEEVAVFEENRKLFNKWTIEEF